MLLASHDEDKRLLYYNLHHGVYKHIIMRCTSYSTNHFYNNNINQKNRAMVGIKTPKSCSNLLINIIMFCAYSLMFYPTAKSEVITVGDSNRWSDGFDYVSWAQQFNFKVGDVLVFSYTPRKHNVYDVTKATFQSCNTSSGVHAMYDSGNDHIELKEAKEYWFICTVDSHCSLGMKVGINVSEAASTNTIQTSNSPSTLTFSNTNFSSGMYLVAFVIFSFLPIMW